MEWDVMLMIVPFSVPVISELQTLANVCWRRPVTKTLGTPNARKALVLIGGVLICQIAAAVFYYIPSVPAGLPQFVRFLHANSGSVLVAVWGLGFWWVLETYPEYSPITEALRRWSDRETGRPTPTGIAWWLFLFASWVTYWALHLWVE